MAAHRNEIYDLGDPDGRLAVFYPSAGQAEDKALLTVVCIHGGDFLFGSKDQISN